MEYLAIFLIGSAIAATLRSLALYIHRTYFTQGVLSDASIHFMIVKQLKKNRHADYIDQHVIRAGPMSYPRGFHQFAALFPLSLLRRCSFLPSLVIHVFGSGAFLTYIHYVEAELLGRLDYSLLIVASVLYFLSVSNLVFFVTGANYITLSPRILGRITTGLYVLCLWEHMLWADALSLSVAIVCGALGLVSSKFARQSILATSAIVAVLSLSVTPLAAMAASAILALLLSRQYLLRGVRDQCAHLAAYAQFKKRGRFHRKSLSRFLAFRELWEERTSVWEFLGRAMWREPLRTFLLIPELVLLAAVAMVSQNDRVLQWWPPLAATAIVYLATSTQRFNHFGESHRYIEYNLYFALPLLAAQALLLRNDTTTAMLLVPYLAYVVLATLGHAFVHNRIRKFPSRDYLADFLQRVALPTDAVVYPVGLQLGAAVCARADCQALYWQPGHVSLPLYEKFLEEFAFLKREYGPLFREFGVTHVICDRKVLQQLAWDYDFSGLDLLDQSEHFIAYSVPALLWEGER